jgi:hypothetical protein
MEKVSHSSTILIVLWTNFTDSIFLKTPLNLTLSLNLGVPTGRFTWCAGRDQRNIQLWREWMNIRSLWPEKSSRSVGINLIQSVLLPVLLGRRGRSESSLVDFHKANNSPRCYSTSAPLVITERASDPLQRAYTGRYCHDSYCTHLSVYHLQLEPSRWFCSMYTSVTFNISLTYGHTKCQLKTLSRLDGV